MCINLKLKGADTVNTTLAERLTQLRIKNNYSQTDVAKRIHVTPALISAYEKTERNPSIDKLIALADIYHTTTDYILGLENKSDNHVYLNVDNLSPKQIELLRNLIETMN